MLLIQGELRLDLVKYLEHFQNQTPVVFYIFPISSSLAYW